VTAKGFLWPQTGGLSIFGGAVWLQQGQVGALLPEWPDPALVLTEGADPPLSIWQVEGT
jgi:hypothetical protein